MRIIQNWEQFNEAKKTSKKKKVEEKDDEKDECECKGLTAKQKKLPPALQKAILKRMKK